MSKSLEALESLLMIARPSNTIETYEHRKNYCDMLENIIKQDLEAYEQLQKDYDKALINNGELCVKISDLKEIDIPVLKHNLEEKCEIIFDLKKENQELREYDMQLFSTTFKLKKALDILKDKRVNIDLLLNSSECPTYNFYAKKQDLEDLTKQEYELLKGVLGND